MAVVPEHQRQGIGTKLIEAGNRKIKDAGYPFIIVVGQAEYYPRFGSRPAIEYGIKWEWDVPDEVFMLLVLNEAKMQGASGLAKYRHEFWTISWAPMSVRARDVCKIFFCPRIKRNDAERNEFVFVYFVWFVGKSEITLALLIN